MMRTNEIKSIMRQLRENQEVTNESLNRVNEAEEDTKTENDTSAADLLLARLEDIISRFEKALAIADGEDEEEQAPEEEGGDEEAPEEEEPAEDEEGGEEEQPEEEEAAEEAYQRSLEDRLAALERRFTESRRRNMCRRFTR
jgi:hypothetical protein